MNIKFIKIDYIINHKDLLIQLTKREIALRHRGTKLGHLWSILTPSLMLCLYLFVFGLIFGGKFGVLKNENFFDFALALFVGLSLFNVISESIGNGPTLVTSQPNFVKKVVFPLEIISVAKVLASMYFCLFSITLCILLIPFTHGQITLKLFYVPIILAPLFMISLGISWSLAALGVFFRDLNQTTNFTSTLLMYGSAIVYSPTKLPEAIYKVLRYNPLLIIINSIRQILLWNVNINVYYITYSYIFATFTMISGYYLFKRLQPYFAEVL